MARRHETWAARIAVWQRSGRTQSAFCREHGWNPNTFQYWLRASKHPSSASSVMLAVGGRVYAGALESYYVIENAIRPIVLGRKNWLFAGSETADRRAAAIMSLLATAKANDLEPHAWLTDVLTRLPTTRDRDIGDLLPFR